MSKNTTLLIKVKDTGNMIGLKEDIAMRLAGVADIVRIDVAEDAAEVKRGYWYFTEYEYLDCSVCGEAMYTGCNSTKEAELLKHHWKRYCPNCGAKMDGERKEK